MAQSAGGSPYYIRNRVKDALVQPAQIETGTAEVDGTTVDTRTVTLRPFESDPNRDRMAGWADLELRVTMSEAVPGWYLALEAEAPDAEGGGPVYLSTMRFDGLSAQ